MVILQVDIAEGRKNDRGGGQNQDRFRGRGGGGGMQRGGPGPAYNHGGGGGYNRGGYSNQAPMHDDQYGGYNNYRGGGGGGRGGGGYGPRGVGGRTGNNYGHPPTDRITRPYNDEPRGGGGYPGPRPRRDSERSRTSVSDDFKEPTAGTWSFLACQVIFFKSFLFALLDA